MQANNSTIQFPAQNSSLTVEAFDLAERIEAVANMIQVLGDPEAICFAFENSDSASARCIGQTLMRASEVYKAIGNNIGNPDIKVDALDFKPSTKREIERIVQEEGGADLGQALESFADLYLLPVSSMFRAILHRYEGVDGGNNAVFQSGFLIESMLDGVVEDSDKLSKQFYNHWAGKQLFEVA